MISKNFHWNFMHKFDVIFISYSESAAEENWQHLLSLVPHAKRVHGVEGIHNAHIEASKIATTNYFFTVDGDNWVKPSFDWNEVPNLEENDKAVHVWRCENSINGLVYGYGGVKLWPKFLYDNIEGPFVDFTTTVAKHGYFIQPETASATRFNSSPEEAWRSGFRESVKLSSQCIKNFDERTNSRLGVWMNKGLGELNGDWAILGARMGCLYGMENKSDEQNLSVINKFSELESIFNECKDVDPILEIQKLNSKLEDFGFKELELM